MASIGQLSGTPSPLADLTFYNNRSMGGVSSDEMNTPRAQAMLSALQKYDPNAQFVASQNGGEGGSGSEGYTLNFDPRLLPGVSGSGTLGQGAAGAGTGNTFMPNFSTVQPNMILANPNAVGNSAAYGKVTDNRNLVQQDDWITKYGPLIIGALGMAAPMAFGAAGLGMGGGAAQAAIGAANGGLAATEGGVAGLSGTPAAWIANAAKNIPSYGNAAANHNFNPVSLIPVGGGALGLPSWATTGASTLGSLAQGGKLNFNPVQLAIAATGLGKGSGG